MKVTYLRNAMERESLPENSRTLPRDLKAALDWARDKTAAEVMEARETTMKVGMLGACVHASCLCVFARSGHRRVRHLVAN